MSNLPNTQPLIGGASSHDAQDDNNNLISKKPGAVFSGKPTSETGFITETTATPEVQKSPESIPTPPPPQPKEPEKKPASSNPILTTEPVQNVIDKTEEITTLHELKETKDKLTKEADEEEEHFIEEVEKHHGDL